MSWTKQNRNKNKSKSKNKNKNKGIYLDNTWNKKKRSNLI